VPPLRPDLSAKVAFLCSPRSYGERPRYVRAIETHFAWIFLTARHAYKLKKPFRRAQMDYRSLKARGLGCRNELRLNRRLAAAVYEAVVPLSTDRSGSLRLGAGWRTQDYLIKMRRLPSATMLDSMLASGRVARAHLAPLIRVLNRFLVRARRQPMSGHNYLARLRRQMRANRHALTRIGAIQPVLIASAAAAQHALLAQERDRLAGRAAFLVEGHGDLRAEHVSLKRPVAVLDCVEFDPDLRRLDPAEDIAQLVLEFDQARRPDLGRWLWHGLFDRRPDSVPDTVLRFYLSHRAMTRARLAAWHIGDPQFPDPQPWIARTNRYLIAARRYAEQGLEGLALRTASSNSNAALRLRSRPALQQRRQRLAMEHARHRLAEQRPDRQHLELGVP
jgi:aminoglycoside phosphotransferase family enzyme